MKHLLIVLLCAFIGMNSIYAMKKQDKHRGIYKCNYQKCAYLGSFTHVLKKHRYIHTHQRPYACSCCEFQGYKENLVKHIKKFKKCKKAKILETKLTKATKKILEMPLKKISSSSSKNLNTKKRVHRDSDYSMSEEYGSLSETDETDEISNPSSLQAASAEEHPEPLMAPRESLFSESYLALEPLPLPDGLFLSTAEVDPTSL